MLGTKASCDGEYDHTGWNIYSTFSASGGSAPYVVDQLEQYRSLGFQIVIVDTSPVISEARSEDWRRLSHDWFSRPNVGYDFASYRAGLQYLGGKKGLQVEALHLVLTNDSCFGPFFPLQRVFDRFASVPSGSNTVFGMTDSHELSYHLQSYWLYFRPTVCSLAFDFFNAMPPAADRGEAIRFGEIGLSRFLVDGGCNLFAYTKTENIVRTCSHSLSLVWTLFELGIRRSLKKYKYTRRGDGACMKYLLKRKDPFLYLNPTLDFGPTLHVRELSPFIKRSLLRSNPFGDASVPPGIKVDTLINREASQILRARRSLMPNARHR